MDATRLGFGQHPFALYYLRALAGLALERRDFDTAERLTERALSISERRWPGLEFQALLDRAAIWAARGQIDEALATVEAARPVLAGTRSLLLARADELEGLLRLSHGDLRSPVELARRLAAAPRSLLLAKIALASGDHHTAQQHLQSPSLGDVVSLAHPKPKTASREALYAYLIGHARKTEALPALVASYEAYKRGETLAIPDVQMEMLTALPLCNAVRLSPRTFAVIRSACFPRARLTLSRRTPCWGRNRTRRRGAAPKTRTG